jgi:hypothetical protein
VTPRDAEVYVDGYYAGNVDDYDGSFQRLRVEPGEHEIAIFRDGYRAFRQKVYLARDNTSGSSRPCSRSPQRPTYPKPHAVQSARRVVQGAPAPGQAPQGTRAGRPSATATIRAPQGAEPRSGQPPDRRRQSRTAR